MTVSSENSRTKELEEKISELEQELSALKDEQQKYRSLFELSGDALSILDLATGQFLECNDSAINMHGVESRENFLNLTPDKLSPEFQPDGKRSEDLAIERIKKTFTDGPQVFKWVHTRLDGSSFPCLVSLSAIPLKDRQLVLAIGRDISDLIEVQEELIQAKKTAESANKAKSDFLSNMSHEIRTPMNAILGFVEQLEKTETNPERLKQFQTISDSGESLLRIINDILDFSKIESGKMVLENKPFNIIEHLNSCIDIFSSLSKDKKVQLHSSIDPSIPLCILGDQTRLKQVVFNLINNAIKFTHSGGDVNLKARFNDESSSIYISVSDSGIGISEDNLEHIFESFSQEDTSITRRFGGTGLGLSISQKLLNLMGARLQVSSKQGAGSTFFFDIPIKVCEIEVSSEESTQEIDSLMINGHILVAEDNKTNQMLMSIILDNFGITYEMVGDGIEAVEKFKTSEFDMILMDENMPYMNGVEASNRIRDLEKNSETRIPIIAVTANALAEDREHFLNAGLDDYISKPYSENDIKQVLIKFLADPLKL